MKKEKEPIKNGQIDLIKNFQKQKIIVKLSRWVSDRKSNTTN